jgi:hypothetical protein
MKNFKLPPNNIGADILEGRFHKKHRVTDLTMFRLLHSKLAELFKNQVGPGNGGVYITNERVEIGGIKNHKIIFFKEMWQ